MKITHSASPWKESYQLVKYCNEDKIVLAEYIDNNDPRIGNFIPKGYKISIPTQYNLNSSPNYMYDEVWRTFNPWDYMHNRETGEEERFDIWKQLIVISNDKISSTYESSLPGYTLGFVGAIPVLHEENSKDTLKNIYRRLDSYYYLTDNKSDNHYIKYIKRINSIFKNSIAIKANSSNLSFIKATDFYRSKADNKDIEYPEFKEILMNKTFGAEFETSSGMPPLPELIRNGLSVVTDGSIEGYEFCTVVLDNDKGLSTFFNGIELLNTYCSINRNCSTHLTIGNLPTNKKFIVSLYVLIRHIQEEMFQLFPSGASNPVETRIKNKGYADKLPPLVHFNKILEEEEKINFWYNSIYTMMTGGSIDKFEEHNNNIKSIVRTWNISTRYYHVNFVKLFNDGIIEFRGHPPTLNKYKMYVWLAICCSICNYAEEHASEIINSIQNRRIVKLYDVVSGYGFVSQIMLEYIEERQYQYAIEEESNAIKSYNLGKQGLNAEKKMAYQRYINSDMEYIISNKYEEKNYPESKILQGRDKKREIPVKVRTDFGYYDEEE